MKRSILLCIATTLMMGCADRDRAGQLLDTPTSGSIRIAVDESLKPLIEAEISAFEGIYKQARIQVNYTSEGKAMEALLEDSARLIIVTRKLLEDEEKALMGQTIVPHQLKIATDGIALIANRANRDSLISLDGLKNILGGTIDETNSPVFTEVVFDEPNSGMIRFMRDSIVPFDALPGYCFALKSNAAVVDYVSREPQSIGLIGVSWISDRDDSTTNSFLNSIRVISIADDSGSYQPYQAYMAQRKYPLVRDVVMISREARSGLASGFMAFIASDKGQRIVLKSGLVPATMPIRILEVNQEPF